MVTLLAIVIFAMGSLHAAPLRVSVVDESGKPIWARLEIYSSDGKRHQPPKAVLDPRFQSAPERPGYPSSFIIHAECEMDVPPGRYTVIAEHGLEYERVETQVEAGTPATIRLKPWIRMNARGWWSADFHIHRPIEQLESLALAEDLNLGIAFTMWNKRSMWEGKALPSDPVLRFSPRHLATLMNAEDERGGGAWMLHQLRQPLALAVNGRWVPPGIDFVREARRQPILWFDSEKVIWWETPVMMALAPPDSIGLLHNHFHQYGMMGNEAWGRPRDAKQFPGITGFADYTTSLVHRYWNLGFRIPPSAGSATGVLPNPAGYNRIYAHLDQPFTVENWYKAYRQGPSFVTNGPMLFWKVDRKGNTLRIEAEAHSREPIDRIEIVANGEVVAKTSAAKGRFTIDSGNHSWVAARCYLKTQGTVRMAHTSPYWLDGKWDARPDARYFVQWLDDLIVQSRDDPERKQLLDLYTKARAFYAAKAE